MLFAPKEIRPERKRSRSGRVRVDPCFGCYRCYCSSHAAWPDHWQRVQHHQRQPLRCFINRIQPSKKALSF